jgi:Periplasmic protease
MRRIRVNVWILVTLLTLLTACRDEADDVIQPGILTADKSLTEQFEAVWNGINQNYVFWEIDPTDWDAIYTQYRPRFVELDKQETVPTADLQKLYEEICGSLIDHHMAVQLRNVKASPEDPEEFIFVLPGDMEVTKREDFQLQMPREGFQVYRDKLKGAGRITCDYEFVDDNPNPDLDHMFTYVIDNDILYLRISNFGVITQLLNQNSSGEAMAQAATAVYREYANQLLFNPDIKGVIVDVRSNGGGYLLDMLTILGPLLKEDVHVFDTRTKMGLGRLDYGEWVPFRAQVTTQRQLGELLGMEEPLPDTDCIGDRRVVVLADSWSVSMSEMTAEAVKKLPYATVIGARTFGGHGPLTAETHFSFSGQFGDPVCDNVSYYVYTSTSMSRTSEGEILEGKGIIPDITVPLDVEQLTGQYIDNQLEYAIDFLHGKK